MHCAYLNTVSQVAPTWCLHSSTCQFGNGIPKARNLHGKSQGCSAVNNLNTLGILIDLFGELAGIPSPF